MSVATDCPWDLSRPLQPLYVVHGQEELLRVEAVDALRAAAVRQGYTNREVHVVEADFDWSGFVLSSASMGLFADLKLIELHIPTGKLGKTGGEMLEKFADRLPEDTVCVVVLPKLEKAQLQAKWFAALQAAGQVWEAKTVDEHALPAWIEVRLRRLGLTIEADALLLFAAKVEGNLLAAKQEVDKLALLYEAGHCLTPEETEAAVADVARFDVFQLAQAWMTGDAVRVLRLLDGLQDDGDAPVLLLWAVAEDVRTLIRLTAALRQGQNIAQVRNTLRLWGKKQNWAQDAVARIRPERLIDALQQCAAIDRSIKGAGQGDAWAMMRMLLMQLAG